MNYIFCAFPGTFGRNSQVVSASQENLKKTAERWRETNGYKDVWVYSNQRGFINKF